MKKTILIILILLMSNNVTSQTTTTLPITYETVNEDGYMPCIAHMFNSRFLDYIVCPYERSFGGERTSENPTNWFYFFLIMIVIVPFMISLSKISIPVILMDFILIVLWGYVPPQSYYVFALLNIFVFAEAIFYRIFAPKNNN